MLTYNFENIDEPLYQYIYKCLKKDIISGNILPNEKLPSKRFFAKNNGISTITIQNAYDQLISEGYIYTIPKKGYYASDISGIKKVQRVQVLPLKPSVCPSKEKFFSLSEAEFNPDNFPFSVWARVMRDVISNKKDALMQKSPVGGVSELKEAIAEHLCSFKGIMVDPSQIIIGAGTQYLYSLIIKLLGIDKIYCVENPGYDRLLKIYSINRIDCKLASMDESGISIDSLRKCNADIAHISPAHHFPTGITMPAARRYEILAWANESSGRYIIEDDYDSEFRAIGRPISPIFSIDVSDRVIYMNTFSKSLSPTIRISYMVLPPALTNKFYENLSFYSCTVSNFEQYTLAEFIKKGYFEKHINRMRLYYSRKRKELLDYIGKSKYSDKCHVIENTSGLHFLLKIDTEKDDFEIQRRLKKKGLEIKALSDYYLDGDSTSRHTFLIDYSNLDIDKLKKML